MTAVIATAPEDAAPEIAPHRGNCPGPWDDERNQWRYECGLPLHHYRVIPD